MNKEISLSMLWRTFVNCWKIIVIFTLLAMILMGLFTNYMVKEKFSSSVTFYVINANPNADYTQQALISANKQLSSDYIEIILSEVMLKKITEDINTTYNLNYTYQQIGSMISANIEAETSMFKVKVMHTNKEHAYIVAQHIAHNAPEIIKKVTKPWLAAPGAENLSQQEKTECVTVINYPVMASSPDSPSIVKNVGIIGVLTAIVVYALCFVKAIFGRVIKTEDDIKHIVDRYPLIGVIPMWQGK